MIALLLAQAATAAMPPSKTWFSVNHDFSCAMRTEQGKTISLLGEAKVQVYESEKTTLTMMDVRTRSADPKWAFLQQYGKWQNAGLPAGSHSASFGPIYDGNNTATAKQYSLEVVFFSRLDGLKGPYGFALLRDGNDGTPLVLEGREEPISAIGPCILTPKGASAK